MVKTIKLEWKEFKVNTVAAEAAIRELAPHMSGCSSDYTFNVHSDEDFSDEEKSLIQTYWDEISEDSSEATSYKSQEDRMSEESSEKAALKASATAKLKSLGLSDAECAAIVGA